MTRQTTAATAWAVLVALAFLACAETKAVLPRPQTGGIEPQPRSSDAGAVEAPRQTPVVAPAPVADAGCAPDTSAPVPAAAGLINVGPDPGRVQSCLPATRFTPLATILAKAVGGRVLVRGRVWVPANYPCTASDVEHCFAAPVLALSRPTGREQKHISLVGSLTRDTSLDCTGRRGALRCPIPIDGSEYGVTGILTGSAYGTTLEVESLCRFRSGARR